MSQTAYLILENGQVFEGRRFGAAGIAGKITGEIVFTTTMNSYLETLTDPNYYGQMVVQTFPLIGNYGVISSDFESDKPHLKAYIVREWCQEPSNFRNEGNLDAFLKSQGIGGLYGIDTRALTRVICEHGVMNARISLKKDIEKADLNEITAYRIQNAVQSVSPTEILPRQNDGGKYHVAFWNFGAKSSILRLLEERDCEITIFPAMATAEQILAYKPDGIVLSNGPGDPSHNEKIANELRQLCLSRIPTFGIGLGHQLLALSQGAKMIKLKYGHRGANQPVRDLVSDSVYMTNQNHGYAVAKDSLPNHAAIRYVNANDGTLEGIDYHDIPAFSVQFHPDSAGGPRSTSFLFDRFAAMMKEDA